MIADEVITPKKFELSQRSLVSLGFKVKKNDKFKGEGVDVYAYVKMFLSHFLPMVLVKILLLSW